MTDETIQRAYDILKILLGAEHGELTHTFVVEKAKQAVVVAGGTASDVAVAVITKRYEETFPHVIVRPPVVLTNGRDEGRWFDEKKRLLEVPGHRETHLERYRDFLRAKDIDERVIEGIVRDSEEVLRHCADPERTIHVSHSKKAGLVVGDVQSGKTMNFLALANLACDYGYRLILILSGLTDPLRQQTQERVDEGLIGAISDTIPNPCTPVGVGDRPHNEGYFAVPLTNRSNDFLKFIRKNHNAGTGDYNKPLVLVVKKNAKVLEGVAEWVDPQGNRRSGSNVLIIDDESDSASVNTNRPDLDPTKINRQIRRIFNLFPNASYVGFTATPFANIFINPDDDPSFRDLFPKDFIVLLQPPSVYFGAERVFSFRVADDGEEEETSVIRRLDESEPDFFPVRHRKTDRFEAIPESLKEAIRCFLVCNAIRTFRGDVHKHRSMLVNITIYNDIHEQIRSRLEEYVTELRQIVEQTVNQSDSDFLRNVEMKKLYDMFTGRDAVTDFFGSVRERVTWENVKSRLLDEIRQFRVEIFNNRQKAADRFSYHSLDGVGARVIAVGGYVLSRGLTLEGLMVSYFSRRASAYDTLLQTCRWFGYRNRYDDLCRVYLTPDSIMNFRAVVDAVSDLKRQFKEMKLRGAKPSEFGLMVKESPDTLETNLLVTSRNKMRHTEVRIRQLNYGGVAPDTSKIEVTRTSAENNRKAVERLFSKANALGIQWESVAIPGGSGKPRKMLRNVPAAIVADCLERLRIHPDNRKFDTSNLSEYIRQSTIFTDWDVVIAPGQAKSISFEGVPASIRLFHKEPEGPARIGDTHNRLNTPSAFCSGLTAEEMNQAARNARTRCGVPESAPTPDLTVEDYLDIRTRHPLLVIYPIVLRLVEKAGKPLPTEHEREAKMLADEIGPLLGFGIGFPKTVGSERVQFRLNRVASRPNQPEETPVDETPEDEEYDEENDDI